jgi:hypothetical protein
MWFAPKREGLDQWLSRTDEKTGGGAEVLSAPRRSAAMGENRSSSVPPRAEFSTPGQRFTARASVKLRRKSKRRVAAPRAQRLSFVATVRSRRRTLMEPQK